MELTLKVDTTEGELRCHAIYALKDELLAVWEFKAVEGAKKACTTFGITLPESLAQSVSVKHYFIGIDNNHFRPWAPKIDGAFIHFMSIGEVGHIPNIEQAKQLFPETLLNIQPTQPKPPINTFPREPTGTYYCSGCLFATAFVTSLASASALYLTNSKH